MSYLDLGFDDNLSSATNEPNFQSTTNMINFEGFDSSQILKLGRIESPKGNFYIDFDKEKIEFPSVSVDKLTSGTIKAVSNLGDENILLDGENSRILINDGTNDRILIGYLENGF